MNLDFYPSDEYECDGAPSVNSGPSSPREVLLERTMSPESKRALLASWASDMRAVENFPALRRLSDGTELHIDEILDALKALDAEEAQQINRMQQSRVVFPRTGQVDHCSSKWRPRR